MFRPQTIHTAPGDFGLPHAMAFDSQGRLFVADRINHLTKYVKK